mmetsp:Transcript_22281/g.71735  ORF Transcript_22281/g.71735 Transcript_22281/m.71735 type:complete len:206 (+) Transcript_22281:1654-2271(+)
MNGSRYATAFFITRALLITCGRNILPAPNRSPTTFMPFMSGPSITASGAGSFWRASSTSCSMKSGMPLTSECASRSSTGASRHAAAAAALTAPPPAALSAASFSRSSTARAISASVAPACRFRMTSSTRVSRSLGMSSYTCSKPALTMPMSMPAAMAWYRKALCIASRITFTPRNPNDKLDTPPDTLAYGHWALISRVASMKSTA